MQRGSATSGSGSSGKLQIWLLAAWRSRPALVLVLATSPRNRGNGNHLRCFSRHRGSTRGYMTFVSWNSLGYIIIYHDIYIYNDIFFWHKHTEASRCGKHCQIQQQQTRLACEIRTNRTSVVCTQHWLTSVTKGLRNLHCLVDCTTTECFGESLCQRSVQSWWVLFKGSRRPASS